MFNQKISSLDQKLDNPNNPTSINANSPHPKIIISDKIAGTFFANQISKPNDFKCTNSSPLELVPEPNNPVDPNAIIIRETLFNCKLGYVSAKLAKIIRPFIEWCNVYYASKMKNLIIISIKCPTRQGYNQLIYDIKKNTCLNPVCID